MFILVLNFVFFLFFLFILYLSENLFLSSPLNVFSSYFFFFGEIHFLLLFTGFRIFIHYTPFNHLIRGSISILK